MNYGTLYGNVIYRLLFCIHKRTGWSGGTVGGNCFIMASLGIRAGLEAQLGVAVLNHNRSGQVLHQYNQAANLIFMKVILTFKRGFLHACFSESSIVLYDKSSVYFCMIARRPAQS